MNVLAISTKKASGFGSSRHNAYNVTVRNIASQHSAQFGVDTPRSRTEKARWIRRIRQEYPFSQFGSTWGVSHDG